MGFFDWFKKKRVRLTEDEEKDLAKDNELMEALAAFNAKNGAKESPLASLPSFKRIPPLIYACEIGKIFMVKDAINHGSDINAVDDEGTTPLHVAAANAYIDIVQLLLEQGADQNIKNKEGLTAADLARIKGHEDVVSMLTGNLQ